MGTIQYCEEDKNMSLIYLLAMWILFLLIVFLIVKYIIPKFKPNDFVIIGFSINMKINTVISIILLFLTFSCKGQNIKLKKNQPISRIDSVKSAFKLTNNQMLRLKKNDTVISELALIIKDSTKINRAKNRINMFFDGKYDLKKLWISIQLERILKDGNFEFSDEIDPKKAMHFETVEELKHFTTKLDSTLKKGVNVKKKVVKDSTNKKQN